MKKWAILFYKFYYIKCSTQEKNNNFPHFHLNFRVKHIIALLCASLGPLESLDTLLSSAPFPFPATGPISQHSNAVTTIVPQKITNIETN